MPLPETTKPATGESGGRADSQGDEFLAGTLRLSRQLLLFLERAVKGVIKRSQALISAHRLHVLLAECRGAGRGTEVEATGFNVVALREVIRLRSIASAHRIEMEATVSTYKQMLRIGPVGILADRQEFFLLN